MSIFPEVQSSRKHFKWNRRIHRKSFAGRSPNETTKARLLCIRLGRLKGEGRANHSHIPLAKMNNASEALKIARTARDMLGANSISLGFSPIRHMLNLETVNTCEGTEDIHTLAVGRDIPGMDAFSCEPTA